MESTDTPIERSDDPPAPRLAREFDILCWIVALVLAILAAGYIYTGAKNLLGPDPFDLHRRWIDEQYFLRRQNPYDVLLRVDAESRGILAPVTSRNSAMDPSIGRPNGGGYPPWSFFSGLIFTSVPWRAAPLLFAGFDFLSLALIWWYGWRLGRPFGRGAGAMLGMSGIAIAGISPAMAWGQYGIIVTALLLAVQMLEERGHSLPAGLLLGISLLKPNISAPFCLCFLVQRRFKALFSAAGYILVSSMVVWIVTRTSPWEMCGQMLTASEAVVGVVPSILSLLGLLHVPINLAIPIAAAGVCAIGGALMFRLRRDSLLVQFAIAAVAARIWTYHRPTDNMMMVPLIAALGIEALRAIPRSRGSQENTGSKLPGYREDQSSVASRIDTSLRHSAISIVAFLAVGISLWGQFNYHIRWVVILIQCLIWCLGLAVLLNSRRRRNFDQIPQF